MNAPLIFHYADELPLRLDRIVHKLLQTAAGYSGVSRAQIQSWIEDGRVTVNGIKIEKTGTVIKSHSAIVISPPIVEGNALAPYDFALDVLYEDEWLVVINKPSGLSMHPGAGNRTETLANALMHHWGKTKVPRCGIVHRLDKDTTGVVVVAKTEQIHHQLSRQFADRTVKKAYQALVLSTPRGRGALKGCDEGEVDVPIGRDPKARTRMAAVKNGGREARTSWSVLERTPYAVLVEARPLTGRTHQIRVHMDYIGCPVIGDTVYGDFSALPKQLKTAAAGFGRQALHAAKLEFLHPQRHERMRFGADLPPDFVQLLATFRAWT